MARFEYTITDEVGIHARPAGMLVKKAKEFGDTITIHCNGKSADATKLMAIMGLGVKKGMQIEVVVEGEHAQETAQQMEQFFKENL